MPRRKGQAVQIIDLDIRSRWILMKRSILAIGETKNVLVVTTLSNLGDGVFRLSANGEIQIVMGQHGLFILGREMGPLGHGEDVWTIPFRQFTSSQITQQCRRGHTENQEIRLELLQVLFEVLPGQFLGSIVGDPAADFHALQHGGHVGQIQRRAIGLSGHALDRCLAAVIPHEQTCRAVDKKGLPDHWGACRRGSQRSGTG